MYARQKFVNCLWRVLPLVFLFSAGDALAREEIIPCPVEMVNTRIVTPLPEPWWETPQEGRVVKVKIMTIGGAETLVCDYWAYGHTASVMRRFPDWANDCKAAAEISGFICASSDPASTVCRDSVQGKVAWNDSGDTTWSPSNVDRLCAGAEDSAEPAACFDYLMRGGVSWGGGTTWQWENALRLCAGTHSTKVTVICFEEEIGRNRSWTQAIDTCKSR